MDRLDAMTVLLRTVDTGSFTGASRALGMPLATVSRKVAELEAHVGAKLLIRTTRRLTLTEVGARYVASARRILEAVDEAERTAAGEYHAPRGELTLTAPILFGRLHVLPLLVDFLESHPDITARLTFSDRDVDLLEDNIDVAARIGPLKDRALVAHRVGSMRTVICACPALLERLGEPRVPEDLEGFPCVTFDFPSPATTWRLGPKAVPIRSRLSVSTAEAAVWSAERGLGASRVLHYQCAEAVAAGRLRLILEKHEPPPRPVHLLHGARTEDLPLKTRVFLDYAIPRLKAALTRIAGESGGHDGPPENGI
jgi:DNA-binding transcriptional LysR family regulator